MIFPALRIGHRLSLWLKLAYTAFMAVLVPVYWHYYGPTNFLYFCDLALFITFVGIWIESSFLVSMCAVGILAPQAVWVADFVSNIVGSSLIGMTDYMFNHENSLFLRGLSLYHGLLPFLLLYLVWALGFHRRDCRRGPFSLGWCCQCVSSSCRHLIPNRD